MNWKHFTTNEYKWNELIEKKWKQTKLNENKTEVNENIRNYICTYPLERFWAHMKTNETKMKTNEIKRKGLNESENFGPVFGVA